MPPQGRYSIPQVLYVFFCHFFLFLGTKVRFFFGQEVFGCVPAQTSGARGIKQLNFKSQSFTDILIFASQFKYYITICCR